MSVSVAEPCGWSFLQSFTNNCNTTKTQDTENDNLYVHPLVKHSSTRLSEESLKMCTESLGSETGSAVTESSNDEFAFLSGASENGPNKQASKSNRFPASKRMNHCRSFPPPLTSISGSNGVQVKPHREGGRLVLKAVTAPSSHALFHAERGDGRLRLRMVEDRGIAEEEEDEEAVGETEAVEEEEEEEEEEDSDAGEAEEEDWCEEEMEGYNGNFGDEMGMGAKRPWLSRCTEGARGNEALRNWEPFWMATYKLSV
ncbi:protein FANTASTIC FOUR 3-like [Corylus avellana]|uniref:protein FANTASTIC FOUR 3-like n=1 Tax=Corylus avellana TaxID=13451 RepID=UPI001E221FDF|nr:protein FANTASTIC FOUR 3-like [Corylus avellana]